MEHKSVSLEIAKIYFLILEKNNAKPENNIQILFDSESCVIF